MNKKSASVLLGVFITLLFFAHALAQKEKEVMKRYDYSSPKASFESLKKAIKEQDIEGILIHQWQMTKLAEETPMYGMSFEDFLAYTTEGMSKQIMIMPPKEAMLYLFNELRPYDPSNPLKVTELDFVKEEEREHDKKEGVTTCWLVLERKTDGTQEKGLAHNYDGTNEWWITMFPHGE